jgi:GTP-binding protein HflX
MVEVWNKWDLLDADRRADLREEIARRPDERIVPLSAVTGESCDDLVHLLGRLLTTEAAQHRFILSAGDGQRLAWLHAHGEVISDVEAEEGADGPMRRLEVRLTPRDLGRYMRL